MSMNFAKRLGLATLGVLAITIAIAGTIAAMAAAIILMGPLAANLAGPPIVFAGVALAYGGAELMKRSQFTFGFGAKAAAHAPMRNSY